MPFGDYNTSFNPVIDSTCLFSVVNERVLWHQCRGRGLGKFVLRHVPFFPFAHLLLFADSEVDRIGVGYQSVLQLFAEPWGLRRSGFDELTASYRAGRPKEEMRRLKPCAMGDGLSAKTQVVWCVRSEREVTEEGEGM